MSANLSCYSKKYEQLRLKKIKSIIDDVKGSIGFQTTSLSGLTELAEGQLSENDVEVKDIDRSGLAVNADNLALSPAASEAQGQVVASSKELQISESEATKDSSPANTTPMLAKREKSPYILTIGDISYQLCYGESYIGRDQSNQIVIDDFHISRLHALVVVHSNNKVAIFDLGSLNGTFVNGRLIKCAAVEVGDNIKLGSYCQLTLSLSLATFGTVIKIKLKGQQIANSSLGKLNQLTDDAIDRIDSDDQSNSSLIN